VVLTFICFVESNVSAVPHMEPLTAMTPEEARNEALRLLRNHSSGVAAHVYAGDDHVYSVKAGELA
jgi:hypothetical protein